MRRAAALLLAITALLSCCTHSPSEGADRHPVLWSPRLGLERLDAVVPALARPIEPPLEMYESGDPELLAQTVRDCRQYFEVVAQGYEAGSEIEFQEQQIVAAHCHTLRILSNAEPAAVSHLDSFELDGRTPERLPAALALVATPEDERRVRAASVQGGSLGSVEPGMKVTEQSPGEVVVEGDGWGLRIEFYARGDFDGDGVEDLLLRVDGWLTEGSFRNTRLFQLTAREPGGPLVVVRELLDPS